MLSFVQFAWEFLAPLPTVTHQGTTTPHPDPRKPNLRQRGQEADWEMALGKGRVGKGAHSPTGQRESLSCNIVTTETWAKS